MRQPLDNLPTLSELSKKEEGEYNAWEICSLLNLLIEDEEERKGMTRQDGNNIIMLAEKLLTMIPKEN